MKFKHGQRVRCTLSGMKVEDAKVSISEEGKVHICQNKVDGSEALDKLGYDYSYYLGRITNKNVFSQNNVTCAEGFYPQVGDIVIDGSLKEREVLAVCDEVFAASYGNDFSSHCDWYRFKEAEGKGWKIKDQDTVTVKIEGEEDKVISRKSAQALGLVK